jgi:hypothetical protein
MEIEWLILADAAQVVGNKLYLLGGGWDRLSPSKGFPFEQRCAIALAIKVPWNETNQKHEFEIEVCSEDQATEELKSIAKINGQFEVGRPAGIPAGQEQHIQLAIDLRLKVDSPGTKIIIARADGTELKRLVFSVLPARK